MATINSLLLLISTLAPPENYPVTTPAWLEDSVSLHAQNAQLPTQLVCGLAETLSCKSHCQKNCGNYDQIIPCPRICVFGCVCIEPFIRGPDGSCIMPYECPATPVTPDTTDEPDDIHCQPDEEKSYFPHCQENCTNYDHMIFCPGYGALGCVCKSPMVRGPDGNCIMSEQCPKILRNPQDSSDDEPSVMKCPPNEDVSCFSHCQPNCTTYDKYVPCPMYCVQGCVCNTPLIRGPGGSCIMPEQCPVLQKITQTPDSQCLECDDYDDEDIENNAHLKAVPTPFGNFKFCDGENEVYKICSSQCPDNCENYNNTRRACKLICLPFPKCECKDGYVRGPTGNCIEPEQCPHLETSPVCPENEEYKECGTACQKNCRNYGIDIPCEFKCESGCFCKEPRIRGPGGSCIYQEECPAKADESREPRKNWNLRFLPDFPKISCRVNEEFSICAPLCPDDCSNYQEDRFCKRVCVPGCKCVEGYVKGKEGTCVKKEECEEKETNDCSELEVYNECGSYCETNCYNYNVTDRRCKDDRCKKGCFCKSELVRSPEGECIPPDSCPARDNSSWQMRFLKRKQRF